MINSAPRGTQRGRCYDAGERRRRCRPPQILKIPHTQPSQGARYRQVGRPPRPLEERTPAGSGRNGAEPDDTIRVDADDLKSPGGLPDEDEPEHGMFYMPPVVSVTVSLFLAYTIFVAVLIALG
jgi:hypothetical protein